MADPVASIEDIKRKAYQAAEYGRPIETCPYPAGSGAAKRWKAFYWQRELELEQKVAA